MRAPLLAAALAVSSLTTLTGCQLTYIVKSAYGQAELLRKRVPIAEALKDPTLPDATKRKLVVAQDARVFSERELGLKATQNYDTYVQLDRPYVTYVVTAAYKNELKAHKYKYPLVGELPYKGFFQPKDAEEEGGRLKEEGYDVYIRGVSAYSTLGWFRDPVLSSMFNYKEFDLVNTIIHETVHATIYIKSEADFNERLATFFGNKGTVAFYKSREGENGKTLQAIEADAHDDRLFAEFMAVEIKQLEDWYAERKGKEIPEGERKARLKLIQERFVANLKPKLKDPGSYIRFEEAELNNARLINYKLYFENLNDFEAVFVKLGGDFKKMLAYAKSLEKSDDPVADLAREARLP